MSTSIKIQSNIVSVIEQLEKYINTIDDKMHRTLSALAGIGVDVARAGFSHAIYDGLNDVACDIEWKTDNLVWIVARGEAVAFIEFGTGVVYTYPKHPKADEMGAIRGEYGYGLGKFKEWRYPASQGVGTSGRLDSNHPGYILTNGNPANRVLYETAKQLRERINDVLKEVW